MTIEVETRIVERLGDGATRDWSFSFRVYAEAHLRVYYRAVDTAPWEVVDSALYTVALGAGNTLSGFAGGEITYPIAPTAAIASGTEVRIELVVPFVQTGLDLNNVSGFNPEALEREIDLGVRRDQQLRDALTEAGFITGPSSSKVDTATGDGSTTAFDLTVTPTTRNAVQVYLDGLHQNQSTYEVSGAQVIFSAAPPDGAELEFLLFSVTTLGEADASQVTLSAGGTVEDAIPLLPDALVLTPNDTPAVEVEGTIFYWTGTGAAPDGGANGSGLYLRKSSAWVFIA